MKLHFSTNALALLLERDRGTVTRALGHVAPDRVERGRPLWKVSTALDALERRRTTPPRSRKRRKIGKYRDHYDFGRPTVLDDLRLEFEELISLINVEKSFDTRRDMALKLAPVLQKYQMTYLEIGRSLRIVDEDTLSARAELIWQEMMHDVSAAAEWPREGGDYWISMCEALPSHIDAEEVP